MVFFICQHPNFPGGSEGFFQNCQEKHFYRTGEKRPFRAFWRSGTEAITPLPIPPFQPARWVSRADGVVI